GQSGSRLTEAGTDLVAEAEKVERAAEALASRATAHQRGLAGAIRVTASESVANAALIPAVAEFRRLYPEVAIELAISDVPLALERGEADVALRGSPQLPDSELIARKVAELDFAIYCSRDYAARRGCPTRAEDLKHHTLIGADGAVVTDSPGMAWMFEQAPNAEVRVRANTLTSLMAAVKAGLGVAPAPVATADLDPDLVRCLMPEPRALSYLWILTRHELKDVPRIRAFIDFVAPFLQTLARDMEARGRAVRQSVGVPAQQAESVD
ncbi:MAG: LysR substrate-binding domain-containing protein, partial [Phenylobacterium sp.]